MAHQGPETEIKFFDNEEKVNITYKTKKGNVIVEFFQTDSEYQEGFGPKINEKELHAKIYATGPLGLKKTEKASVKETVYHSENGLALHKGFEETGQKDFFENVKNTAFNHPEANVVALVKQAQKDISKDIPRELQRRNLATIIKSTLEATQTQ